MPERNASRFVGQSVQRREDPRLLSGRGEFVDDIVRPGMLHAAFVRSPVARGRIVRLDVTSARAQRGVHAVLTGADFADRCGPTWQTLFGPSAPYPPQHPLAVDDVRFVGDPVVLVVAESRALAEDAADLVELEVASLTPALDPVLAAEDTADPVHPELGTNVAGRLPIPNPPPAVAARMAGGLAIGDPSLEAAFAASAHVLEETFVQHRHATCPMEGRGLVVAYDPSRSPRLRIWAATQAPHELRLIASRFLDVPEHEVHVVMRDVGGAFGLKGLPGREDLAVLFAARDLCRPVKWIEDRSENLTASAHARDEHMTVRMGFDAQGRITAATVSHLENCGAFPLGSNGSTGALTGLMFPAPYKVPVYASENLAVYTNTCGRGAYRGPWMMETVAREIMMDIAARRMGIDPVELRRRNVVTPAEMPHAGPTGLAFDATVTIAPTLERAVEAIGYDAFRREQAAARAEGRYVGLGVATYVEPSGMAFGAMGAEAATVRIHPGGRATVYVGCASHGQGLETTIPQVVADELGVPIDDVTLVQGDTASTGFSIVTGGSRSAVMYSGAAARAAQQLREKVLRIAAHTMEAAPEDLRIADGIVSVAGTPARTMSLGEIAGIVYTNPEALPSGAEGHLDVTATFTASQRYTFTTSTHVCTCEVDAVTYQVRILRYLVSEDCGMLINPMVVDGQIAGGVVQGIGGVLYEHLPYDGEGNPLATTFLDYLVPTAAEVPMIEYVHLETPASSNPGGFKGVGEGGAIGSPPAVVNAVADALAPLGVEIRRQPLGPENIFELVTRATRV